MSETVTTRTVTTLIGPVPGGPGEAADHLMERPVATDPNAIQDGLRAAVGAAGPDMSAAIIVLRAKLTVARGKIIDGTRLNMLNQVADGCIDTIEALLSVLPN
ncbi:MAG TPA: hypothetical protein VIO57_10400 [Chloroflexota bacterium]|jgi:hypothetical protein